MTGSPLLDLFLAMAMFYFALCMFCSSANDAVARVLKWRAATLHDGIRSLLLNAEVKRKQPDGTEKTVELASLFFEHPFVQTLRLQAELGDTWLERNLDGLKDRLFDAFRALAGRPKPDVDKSPLDPKTKLTFIPSGAFVHTLCEILKPDGWGENEPLTPAALWRAIDQLPEKTAGPLKVVLKSVAREPGLDLDAVQTKLAKWFDAGMEQATVWFRQRMRTASLIVGAVFVIGLNVDSIQVANRLYRDAKLRTAYVASAERVAAPGEKKDDDKPQLASPIDDLNLGWQTSDWNVIADQLTHGMKWAGLLVTILAIGMGAPFWHDVITRLVPSNKKQGSSEGGK